MIALLYCSSVVRVIDLPECSLFNREINYGCGPFYSLRHFPVDLFHKTSQNTHTISKVKIFSICLPEFKYLYDASLDHNFTTLLSRYLKCSKNLPALFIISLYQREICDVPMWQVVCSRLVKSIVIEESMAWLSTLGGGYSSLGDQNDYAASLAGTVSIFQMSLALEINSPTLLAKSQLWFAQSLMQRGFLKHSARILRQIYTVWKPLMRPDLPCDMRIDHMALGLWARLRHLWQQKHKLSKKNKESKHYIPLPVNSSLISFYPHVNMLVSRI